MRTQRWLAEAFNGISSVEWKVYVVRKRRRGPAPPGSPARRFSTRAGVSSRWLRCNRELEEVVDHPLPRVLKASNAFALGLTTKRLTQLYLELVGEAFWIIEGHHQRMDKCFAGGCTRS